MRNKFAISAIILAVIAGGVGYMIAGLSGAQHSTPDHGGHPLSAMPTEAGQSAFAATAEIVSILSSSSNTVWKRVNISMLRQHLVDMNALFMEAQVSTRSVENGWAFEVLGSKKVLRAIHAMVPAHAQELDKMEDWTASTTKTETGVVLTVQSSSPTIQQKIEGLGFFGLMATGAHHQPHHLAMATGQPMDH
jgi:hypothetical protein